MGDKMTQALADIAKILKDYPDTSASDLYDVLQTAEEDPANYDAVLKSTREVLADEQGDEGEDADADEDDKDEPKTSRGTAREGDVDEVTKKPKSILGWEEPEEPAPLAETHPDVAAVLKRVQEREDAEFEAGDFEGAEFLDKDAAARVHKATANVARMMQERGLAE